MTNPTIPFIKYVDIKEVHLDDLKKIEEREVEVYEKMDGGLCQIRNVHGQVLPGSKANFLKGGHIVRKTEWFSKFVNWAYSNTSLYDLPPNLIFFGEWNGNHTIQYNPEHINKFFLIDILDTFNSTFLDHGQREGMIENLKIDGFFHLPPLYKGHVSRNDLEKTLSEPSGYYHGRKEGIVVKDYKNEDQRFFKVLNPEFSEKRQRRFGRIDPFTDARFRKAIMRVYENSNGLVSFPEVVTEVINDVKKEIGKTYTTEYVTKRLSDYTREGVEKGHLQIHISHLRHIFK